MGSQITVADLRRSLAEELKAAIEAVAGAILTAAPAPVTAGPGWGTEIAVSGALRGRVVLWVDDAGVTGIAKAMMGLDEAPERAVIVDMLREVCAQAASAAALEDGFEGVTLATGTPVRGTVPAEASGFAIAGETGVVATIAIDGTVDAVEPAPTPVAAAGLATAYPGNLAALLDIDLALVVRFARTDLSLRTLTQLGPGSMVDMGRSPDAPVQVLVGGQVIAEGEVVVVGGNYGVRITSLVSPADRLRAMEL